MSPSTPPFAPEALRRIEVVAFPDVQLLDVAGPLQVFATACDLALRTGSRYGHRPYEAVVIVAGGGSFATSSGLALIAQPLSSSDEQLDTLIVAGGRGVDAASRDQDLVAWILAKSSQCRRIVSVCSGAFLLAETGLLDGRRAVTHWEHCDDLRRRHPAVRVESDPIFIRDGDLWTSAGVTAGIDLALALVEDDLGRAAALAVARQLVVFLKRPGGQCQHSVALDLQSSGGGFERLHAWMADHLTDDLGVAVLAREAGMSQRSFLRHYPATTGLTPARAVERLRIEAARHLLCETMAPIKRVAQRCGFGTDETMRRAFLRVFGASPQDYRERFGIGVPATTVTVPGTS
ncbi:MAG: GlxA family transcriptional regulator [Janthinobacterium lividum]